MDNKNALQITTQYPAERYNLLVPMQTVAEIAEIHKPVMKPCRFPRTRLTKRFTSRKKPQKHGLAETENVTRQNLLAGP